MSPVKLVILGSCKHEPYEVLAMPNKLDPELYERDHEEAYKQACEVFYPAIKESDFILVYAPEGIGEHTGEDLRKAIEQNKPYIVYPRDIEDANEGRQIKERLNICRKAIMILRKDPRNGWGLRQPSSYPGVPTYPLSYGFYGLTDYILTGDSEKIMDPTLRDFIMKEIYERSPIKPNEDEEESTQ